MHITILDNVSSENHILQQLMVEIEVELSEVSWRMSNNKAGWAERMECSEENWKAIRIRSKLFQYSVYSKCCSSQR